MQIKKYKKYGGIVVYIKYLKTPLPNVPFFLQKSLSSWTQKYINIRYKITLVRKRLHRGLMIKHL